MTINPYYLPGPTQSDADALARAQALGVTVGPRTIPPCYEPFVTQQPGVVAEYGSTRVVFLFDDGTLTSAQVTTAVQPLVNQQAADQQSAANQAALQQRAANALANNATYLGLASPTTAQAVAQVQALTHQSNAVIRLLLNQFDSVAGT